MKIIHWEYNSEALVKPDDGEAIMKVGAVRDNDNNQITGVWFSWTYLVSNADTVGIHCVGQEGFITRIENLDLITLLVFRHRSFENFKKIFNERMDIIDQRYHPPKFIDDHLQLADFLYQLRREI